MKNFAELDSLLGADLVFQRLGVQENLSQPYTQTVNAVSKRADLDLKAMPARQKAAA